MGVWLTSVHAPAQHFEGFDPEGYSIWFCEYKYPEENTVNYIVMNKVGERCLAAGPVVEDVTARDAPVEHQRNLTLWRSSVGGWTSACGSVCMPRAAVCMSVP